MSGTFGSLIEMCNWLVVTVCLCCGNTVAGLADVGGVGACSEARGPARWGPVRTSEVESVGSPRTSQASCGNPSSGHGELSCSVQPLRDIFPVVPWGSGLWHAMCQASSQCCSGLLQWLPASSQPPVCSRCVLRTPQERARTSVLCSCRHRTGGVSHRAHRFSSAQDWHLLACAQSAGAWTGLGHMPTC